MTTWGILYLVILNRADFSTQVLSVVLPRIPAGPKSKVKSHMEPCRLVFIPFGRISTFFGYLRFMLYVSLSGLFALDSRLTDCYSHRLEGATVSGARRCFALNHQIKISVSVIPQNSRSGHIKAIILKAFCC